MTYQASAFAKDSDVPIVILSQREEFAGGLSDSIAPERILRASRDAPISDLMDEHRKSGSSIPMVLIVDSDPELEGYLEQIEELRAGCANDGVIISLIPSDASFDQARRLRAAGADEVLPDGIGAEELNEQITHLIEARRPPPFEPTPGKPPGSIIAVAQARGGVGSTTVAVNLACGLAEPRGKRFRRKATGKRVALVDLDLQFGNAGVLFDVEDNGGLMQIFSGASEPDDHLLRSAMIQHDTGVDILGAPLEFVPLHMIQADLVATLLAMLQQHYDYVVVDMPRAMVEWIEPIIAAASLLVLTTDTTVPCIRHAQRIIKFFREENVVLPVHVVVNREKRGFFKSEHVREAEKVLELQFNEWLPENTPVARKAADLGRPVILAQSKSDLARALAKMVASVEQATNSENVANA